MSSGMTIEETIRLEQAEARIRNLIDTVQSLQQIIYNIMEFTEKPKNEDDKR